MPGLFHRQDAENIESYSPAFSGVTLSYYCSTCENEIGPRETFSSIAQSENDGCMADLSLEERANDTKRLVIGRVNGEFEVVGGERSRGKNQIAEFWRITIKAVFDVSPVLLILSLHFIQKSP